MSFTLNVSDADGEARLDRFLRRRFPHLLQGRLEQLLRKGAVKLNGAKAKSSDRVKPGDEVLVPYGLDKEPDDGEERARPRVSDKDADLVRGLVLHDDGEVLVLNKPPGIAVQGGTRTTRHLDAMVAALADGGDVPKLAHRLDRDTSGVLVFGRTPAAAAFLARAFQSRQTEKIYWAVVLGVPTPRAGEIRSWMAKGGSARDPDREIMRLAKQNDEGAVFAITHYAVLANAAMRAAFVGLKPETGRTHQLRFHMSQMGHAILGDRKYVCDRETPTELGEGLHLHARALAIPHPNGKLLKVVAPLPDHMTETFEALGFSERDAPDPFAAFLGVKSKNARAREKQAAEAAAPAPAAKPARTTPKAAQAPGGRRGRVR
jgi:23S rRNA pseudouridine955/2504/2580 synthase